MHIVAQLMLPKDVDSHPNPDKDVDYPAYSIQHPFRIDKQLHQKMLIHILSHRSIYLR